MSYYWIREAQIQDREDCIAIARMYPDTRTFSSPWYSGQELFIDSTDIYVLDEGGVGGFYSAQFHKRDEVVALSYIAVAVPGHGLGVELLNHLKRRVRLSGTHQVIRSKVGQRSRNFWIRNGFELEDDRAVWST